MDHRKLESKSKKIELLLNQLSRFAIILSKEHKLAKLIALCVESLSNHVGVKQTLNEFRNRFLIAQEGSFVKKVVYVKKV